MVLDVHRARGLASLMARPFAIIAGRGGYMPEAESEALLEEVELFSTALIQGGSTNAVAPPTESEEAE